jgi:pimeloyl-ACP methyl ester carboxylesterase
MRKSFFSILFLSVIYIASAQKLKPGFDVNEYISLMKLSAQFGDSAYAASVPVPPGNTLTYRSPVMGLDNRWDLWTNKDGVAVISIRGTTTNELSWLANFYAAMVPAKGSLQLTDTDVFNYDLADDDKAAVHVGWLVSTGFLSKDILSKIDSCNKKGTKNFIVMGHSQGGAIAFLLTAYLLRLQKQNALPQDIRFKTYCSAGPKPGNLYFAYAYEAMTQGGWAYNIVNSADWVPETPFSVQTVHDFNTLNPFTDVNSIIKKQKFPKNLALTHVYNKLKKPAIKAQKNYEKYLGSFLYKMIKKNTTEYKQPEYANTSNYVRTGTTIVLLADDDYYKLYPDTKGKTFMHHFHQPYLYLTQKQLMNTTIK